MAWYNMICFAFGKYCVKGYDKCTSVCACRGAVFGSYCEGAVFDVRPPWPEAGGLQDCLACSKLSNVVGSASPHPMPEKTRMRCSGLNAAGEHDMKELKASNSLRYQIGYQKDQDIKDPMVSNSSRHQTWHQRAPDIKELQTCDSSRHQTDMKELKAWKTLRH